MTIWNLLPNSAPTPTQHTIPQQNNIFSSLFSPCWMTATTTKKATSELQLTLEGINYFHDINTQTITRMNVLNVQGYGNCLFDVCSIALAHFTNTIVTHFDVRSQICEKIATLGLPRPIPPQMASIFWFFQSHSTFPSVFTWRGATLCRRTHALVSNWFTSGTNLGNVTRVTVKSR